MKFLAILFVSHGGGVETCGVIIIPPRSWGIENICTRKPGTPGNSADIPRSDTFADNLDFEILHHVCHPAARKGALEVSPFQKARPYVVVGLTHQYRMNEDIIPCPTNSYVNHLRCGSEVVVKWSLVLLARGLPIPFVWWVDVFATAISLASRNGK